MAMFIRLWMFPFSPGNFVYFLKEDDGTNYLDHDIVKPKQWHHLCIGMDGGSNTVHGVLVNRVMKLIFQERERYRMCFVNLGWEHLKE